MTETESTSVSWRAASLGKYHVTVVAYNRALEASVPVCSDGVTVDTTPPSVDEVRVLDTHTAEGLVKPPGTEVWFVDNSRQRKAVSADDSCRYVEHICIGITSLMLNWEQLF